MIHGNWKGRNGGWCVIQLDELPFYEKINDRLHRLLVLFLIDPLAFISRMRIKINASRLIVSEFFNTIESNIEDILNDYLIKYMLIEQMKYVGIVNDVVHLVISNWVYAEVYDLEREYSE